MKRFVGLLMLSATLIGCQTEKSETPVVKAEDARKLAFETTTQYQFEAPPRSIGFIQKDLGTVSDNDYSCEDRWQDDARFLEQKIKSYGDQGFMHYFIRLSGDEFGRWDATDMLRLINKAIDEAGKVTDKMGLMAQKVRFLAWTGDKASAEAALAELKSERPTFLGSDQEMVLLMDIYLNVAEAAVLGLDGKLIEAEIRLRAADKIRQTQLRVHGVQWRFWQATEFGNAGFKGDLARNLLAQGRNVEAEALTRELFWFHRKEVQPAVLGDIMSLLANILLEQERLEDADWLVQTALTLHRKGCSRPTAFSHVETQLTAAKIAALLDRPREAAERYGALKRLGRQAEWIEHRLAQEALAPLTLIRINQLALAQELIDTALSSGHLLPYAAAERHALARMIDLQNGKPTAPFITAALVLAEQRAGRPFTQNRRSEDLRLSFILNEALARLQPAAMDGDQDALEQSFMIGAALVGQGSSRAVIAQAARAAAHDPQLKDLIRQRQDTELAIKTLQDSLRRQLALNPGTISVQETERTASAMAGLQQDLTRLDQDIAAQFPDFGDLTHQRADKLSDVQQSLADDTALYLTYQGPEQGHSWSVTRSAVRYQPIALSAAELGQYVDEIRAALDVPLHTIDDIPAFNLGTAHLLYQALLAPHEPVWKEKQKLVFVPSRPLATLPPGLLVATAPPELNESSDQLLFTSYRQIDWLIKDHAISVLPSVSSLIALARLDDTAAEEKFLGIADPVFNKYQRRQQQKKQQSTANRGLPISMRAAPNTMGLDYAVLQHLPALPDTRIEVEAIAELLGDQRSHLILGSEATEQSLRSFDYRPYRLISIATHGLKPGDVNGLAQPALVLSDPGKKGAASDGLLTVAEILPLKLNADWVALSACNTAAADGTTADAMSGLARAFFYAGAKSVLVSHWPVHSIATRDWMTDLYQTYVSNPTPTRAEAVQQATVKMIDQGLYKDSEGIAHFAFAHPIFWAPFTLVGDGGR